MIYAVIASALFLTFSIVVLGSRRPQYSHLEHSISELGERGCAHERLVAYGVFLPFGLAMTAIAVVMRSSEPVVLLAGGMAVGYVGAAFFPIDAGAPLFGNIRNTLHWLAAGVEYVGAVAAFDAAGREYGSPYTTIKVALLLCLIAASVPALWKFRGLLQRVMEIVMVIGLGAFVQGS